MSSTEAKGTPRVLAAPATTDAALLIGVAYLRQSQASGKGGSEDAQNEAIRDTAGRLNIDLKHDLPFDEGQSSFTLERPSFQEALRLLAGLGPQGRLIVAKLNRLTRRRKHWEEILDLAEAQGWQVVSAEFPELDLHTNEGRMIAGLFIDQGEREYREAVKSGANARRSAVLKHGVHGGAEPPLGYEFTVRGYDKNGRRLRGPLKKTADAKKVRTAFERRADGAPWSEIVKILGSNSLGAATQLLANRAYLGEARSGDFVREGAHPAIVDAETFQRANRKKTPRSVSYVGREGAPLGGGILRCGSCSRALTRDTNPRGDLVYRCKNAACTHKVTVQAHRIEPLVVEYAKGWHAVEYPDFALTRAVEDALLPALEDAYQEALAEVERVKASKAAGKMSPTAYGEALTDAENAVKDALRAVEDAEGGRGWLGLAPEKVAHKLGLRTETVVVTKPLALLPDGSIPPEGATFDAETERIVGWDADAETVRSFTREMVRVFVFPVGRGQRVPVESRIRVQYLTAGKTSEECGPRPPYSDAEVEAILAEMAAWPKSEVRLRVRLLTPHVTAKSERPYG